MVSGEHRFSGKLRRLAVCIDADCRCWTKSTARCYDEWWIWIRSARFW